LDGEAMNPATTNNIAASPPPIDAHSYTTGLPHSATTKARKRVTTRNTGNARPQNTSLMGGEYTHE